MDRDSLRNAATTSAFHGKSHDCAVSLSPCRSCPRALPCRLHKHTRWSTDADSSTPFTTKAEDVRRSGASVMKELVSLAPLSAASFAVFGFCTHTQRNRPNQVHSGSLTSEHAVCTRVTIRHYLNKLDALDGVLMRGPCKQSSHCVRHGVEAWRE